MDLDWRDVRAILGRLCQPEGDRLPFADHEQSRIKGAAHGAMELGARLMRIQLTGGSRSTADGFTHDASRRSGVRAVLVEVASRRLRLAPAVLRTEGGAVLAPDGARFTYAELAAEEAAGIAPPGADAEACRRVATPRPLPAASRHGSQDRRHGLVRDRRAPRRHALRRGLGEPNWAGRRCRSTRRRPSGCRALRRSSTWAAPSRRWGNAWAATRAAEAVVDEWGRHPFRPRTETIFDRWRTAVSQNGCRARLRRTGSQAGTPRPDRGVGPGRVYRRPGKAGAVPQNVQEPLRHSPPIRRRSPPSYCEGACLTRRRRRRTGPLFSRPGGRPER